MINLMGDPIKLLKYRFSENFKFLRTFFFFNKIVIDFDKHKFFCHFLVFFLTRYRTITKIEKDFLSIIITRSKFAAMWQSVKIKTKKCNKIFGRAYSLTNKPPPHLCLYTY